MKLQKEWIHMDKLEPEKLQWIRDLPAPRKKGTKKVGGSLHTSNRMNTSRHSNGIYLFIDIYFSNLSIQM